VTGTPRLTIIADDLTGAADTGAPFALAGFTTTIVFGTTVPRDTDVLVVNTNSRGLSGSDAAEANRTAVQRWVSPEGDSARGWVYKKIDSALRGHPAAELAAVMDAMGTSRALVAPALPAEGRSTVGGRQFLDGIPLEDTPFGAQGVTSDLIGLFTPHAQGKTVPLDLATVRQGSMAIAEFLNGIERGVVIADAETNDDLAALAQAIALSGVSLLAGTAGLARQVAGALDGAGGESPLRPASAPGQGTLIVAGSRDQVTANQVDHLREHGIPIVTLAAHHLDGHLLEAEVLVPLAERLEGGESVVLTTVGLHSPMHGPGKVRGRLATIVATPAIRSNLGGLVLTGGDVAMGILQELTITELRLGGEVRPALPWTVGHFAAGSSLPVVTKAGSFGEADALLACLDLLRRSG
jgi:uncharacterized protein YgbK (DUF1537 family)